jgi:hypothetical protein
LRKLLVQGAHVFWGGEGRQRFAAVRSEAGGAGRQRGRRKALVAVARKLAMLLDHLWATGEVYEPLRNHRAPALEAVA